MNILVIGSGGREHALTWKIAQSELVARIFCAPGNPGMAGIPRCRCVAIDVTDFTTQKALIQDEKIDLVVVGPEVPLAEGVSDVLAETGCLVFGPSAAAARIESSKEFAKDFMMRHGIPTAAYEVFDDAASALAYVRNHGVPLVIKADGLAAGKGVTVAHTIAAAEDAIKAIMIDQVFGGAGARVVIEEFLEGEEASILAFSDGETLLPLLPSQDHKPVYDLDQGPNTGGMGAYAPAPLVSAALLDEIEAKILRPCVAGFAADGTPYCGMLYAGLMIGPRGPRVVEFNCRFGDPETQVVLPLLDCDILPLFEACCRGTLQGMATPQRAGAAVTVVMASGGYPGEYGKGLPITGIADAESEAGITVFHAGTAFMDDMLVTNGGRVLNVTAQAGDVAAAIDKAYRAVDKIHFQGAHCRRDIGAKALDRA